MTADLSRLKLQHPDLGTAGGAALYSQIEAIYQKLGDNLATRFMTSQTIADSGTYDFEHNFKDDIANLRVDLYTVGVGGELTRITANSTPNNTQVTYAATTGQETTHITITNSSGSSQDIAMVVFQDPINLRELVDVNIPAPEDGQALVYNQGAGEWQAGASGDASFKMQSLATNSATIKAGAINLGDGKQLNLASDLTIDLKTEVNSGGVTAPSASTRYYVYLDLSLLPTQTATGVADRLVYEMVKGTGGNFVVLAEDPENVDLSRYVHLYAIKTDGSGDYQTFENLAFREHQTSTGGSASTLVETVLSDRSIGTVGAVDSGYGALADADFPNTTTLSYFHLAGDGNDDSPNAQNLTAVGTPIFDGKGFFERENVYRTVDGETNRFDGTGSNFAPNGANWSTGAWVKTDWTQTAGFKSLFANFNGGASQRLVLVGLPGNGTVQFSISDLGTNSINIGTADISSFTDGWHHFAVVWDGVNNLCYLDGKLVVTGTTTPFACTSGLFQLGLGGLGNSANEIDAEFQDAFFHTGTALTEAQVNAIYSKRFTGQQIAAGHVLDADSWPCADLTDRIYFWNLAADANDDSGNGKNLTNNGATPFTGLDRNGLAGAPAFNGVDRSFSTADAAFDFTKDFMVGGWVKNLQANQDSFIGHWNASPDRGWLLRLNTDGSSDVVFINSPDGVNANVISAPVPEALPGGWYHIAAFYRASDNFVKLYYNGQLVGTGTATGGIFATTADLKIGQVESVFLEGSALDVFWSSDELSEQDIKKLYSMRLDLAVQSQQVTPAQRIFAAQFESEDGKYRNQYDLGWLIDNRTSKLYVDFGQEPVGGKVSLRLHDGGVGASTVAVKKFDRTYTSTPPATIAHNMPDTPTAFAVLHDELANGIWGVLDPSNFLKADGSNIYTSGFDALTIDASHPLRIVAQVGAPSLSQATGDNENLNPTSTELTFADTGLTVKNNSHNLVDTTGGAPTFNLPASPLVGDRTTWYDTQGNFNTNNLTIGRNGELIEGAAADFVASVDSSKFELVFVGGSVGWKYYG